MSFLDSAAEILTGDLVTQFSAVFGPQWGIFQDGELLISSESVVAFEFKNDWTISDYPVEGGVFETYDKVLLPYVAKVRFASGSSIEARVDLLSQIAEVAGSFDIYDVVTPEITYLSCNITHYDYRREAQRGVGLVVVDVWVTQVIVQNSGGLNFGSNSNPNLQNSSSADPQNQGTVQTTDLGS